MANIGKILKEEIILISQREARVAVAKVRKENAELRAAVLDLKRRQRTLERATKASGIVSPPKPAPSKEVEASKVTRARPTAAMVQAVRKRLGLSQKDFATLLGVSQQSVTLWESKEGRLNLRSKAKAALLRARAMGKREAAKALQG